MSVLNLMPSGRHVERILTLDRRKIISFTGKSFYLDLPHNKQTQLLTKTICGLGGVIESFLSRDVNYVVTGGRKGSHVANEESSERKGGNSQHPTTDKIEKTPYSRGKQLLKKVVQSQECSSILSSARSWGVCILHVDVLEYLECPTQRRTKRPAEGKGPGDARRIMKVGKLKSPFLKIEDQSRKYRPIHCSFSKFPECSFISSDRSPFETARTIHSTPKDRDPGEQDKHAGERPQNWEKSGYCECCQITYTKLHEHLISEQHCIFALNASNYRFIDDLASVIVCDLDPLPPWFKPNEEQCGHKAPPQTLEEEPPIFEEVGLENGESKDQPMDELPTKEHNLASPEEQLIKQDAECHPEDKETLSKDPPVEIMAVDSIQEHFGSLPENLLTDKFGHQCTVSTANAVVQCDLPLVETCGTEEPSPLELVTAVSWYTEEAGLTSVYTVQSLVMPPTNVLEENPELTTENILLHPSLCLEALGNPLHGLAQGGFSLPSNEPIQEDPVVTAHIYPEIFNAAPSQSNVVGTDVPHDTSSGAVLEGPSPAPSTERECTLHHETKAGPCSGTDASLTDVPLVKSAIDQHPNVLLAPNQDELLVNAPSALQSGQSSNLCVEQFTLAPWHAATEDNDTVKSGDEPLDTLFDEQDSELLVPKTDWCGGKRKHCWSPCHPAAKRPPLHCQPMPMWVLHQLPSSEQQPTIPVFSGYVDRDLSNKAAEGNATTLCYNPKLAQYEASSESDWDSQLVSQDCNNPQQAAHLGELRTAQVSLDESWYRKQLGSVLAHEQTLGSPSTTQTVTLSHTSYDLYLSGVAS
ncbi:protein DBF4 homolog B isoform 2-T2 [Anomaloglossus baeobatrachus]